MRDFFSQYLLKPLLFSSILALSACATPAQINNLPENETQDITLVPEVQEIDPVKTLPPYRASETRDFDLLHTRLDISFDYTRQEVIGKAWLALTPYFYPQSQLELDAKGFKLNEVSLFSNGEYEPLPYDYSDSMKLVIDLPFEATRNDTIWVYIDYTAIPHLIEEGGSEAISSDKGLYFINPNGEIEGKPVQVWTQGETESNSKWFPTIDKPNERTTQETYVTVNDQFKTLSNGLLVSSQKNDDGTRTDYWQMNLPHAPYLFMLAIGDYAVVNDDNGDLPISYYVEPYYEPYAKDIFGNTPEMITFFSGLLGTEYPWPKYSQVVVRDFVSGAMENTTASTFMERVQQHPKDLVDENWDYIIAHELFHQWFGDYVTTESWANITLNEAFASYSEYLWNEYKYGEDEAEYKGLEELEGYLLEFYQSDAHPLIRWHYEKREDVFDSHSYNKGSRVLHMLRNYVGDEAFFEALRVYLDRNAFNTVEVHDLRLAFEDVTGEDLNWFFDQWFLKPGHPVLNVEKQYQDGKLSIIIAQMQDTTRFPVYRLPLYVDLVVSDQILRYPIVIEQSLEEFIFPLPAEPEAVIIDGDQQLLGEINIDRSPEEWTALYESSASFVPRWQAVNQAAEAASHELLQKALDDPFYIIRALALQGLLDSLPPQPQNFEEKVYQLATTDSSSLVRSEALYGLTTFGTDKYLDTFIQSLNDTSYAVNGSALFGISQSSASREEKMAHIEKFMKARSSSVTIPIGDYAAQNQDTSFIPWFEDKINYMHGQDLWVFLNLYGQVLFNGSEEQQIQGAATFERIALNNTYDYVRLMAYRMLDFLSIENIDEIKSRIRSHEKDQALLESYQNMDSE
ncbi:M1 family aminopeptidase [Roseivirga sp. BDSF3-8]|uniref:M1 family aminopeptidase n=1 Tax=Roseivirga sp. BDSF3-8 TaxID=3241598 RepID=UPI0035321F20